MNIRMTKSSRLLISLTKVLMSVALVLPCLDTNAGGWPQKKGEGYFKFGQFALFASEYYNPEGNLIRIEPTISLYTTSLYGEYGLTDRLTMVGYIPFFTRSILNNLQKRNGEFVEGDQLTSFGDTDIGFKYGLTLNKPIAVSATLSFGLPFGNPGGEGTSSLQTGDGEFNQKIIIEASKSFYPVPVYASIFGGVNNRTNGFSEELHYGAEVGFTYEKVTLIAKMAGVESFMNGLGDVNAEQSVFGNNIEFLMISPEIVYEFSSQKAGITASVMKVLSGRQILASPAYSAGVYLKI